MDDSVRGLIGAARDGRLTRREAVRRMVALGLSAPTAGSLLLHAGVAQAATASTYRPTVAGGGGALRILFWQAVTLINPHFAVGTKDQAGSRIFYEPLAGWDDDGNLYPVLAAEIPTRENGGLSADGTSVTWKLKPNVKWHDGEPFTADDLVFNWQWSTDPATAATTTGSYKDVKVEKIDDLTARVTFPKPTPFWADPFVGTWGMIIPRHLFKDYIGDRSRDAPTNLKPVGTGPYRFVEFRPGDVLRAERNPTYHLPNRPHFDTLELKGGGDAVSAARAVMQTGEYDYAWNMQVEDEILKRMEAAGKGRIDLVWGGNIEFVLLNATDPNVETDGERASLKTKHFAFVDPKVREAFDHLLDRGSVEQYIYGRTAKATGNVVNGPPRFVSGRPVPAFDVAKANALLDEAGWARGPDGIRAKGGKRLKLVFQTSVNAPRQKTQAIIKQAAQKAGIDLELKSVAASVFFSSDVANPDTYTKFYADVEMYTTTMLQPDPETFMRLFLGPEAATKDNKWQGRNITRWQDAEYDRLYAQGTRELDPTKRAALFQRCNDLAVSNYTLPLLWRATANAASLKLKTVESGWDTILSGLSEWYRDA